MLLGLASGNTFLEPGDGLGTGNIASVNPELAAVAKQAFYDFGERPIWAERVTYGTSKFTQAYFIIVIFITIKVMFKALPSLVADVKDLLCISHGSCDQSGKRKLQSQGEF
jgi:hypothetical protein